MKAWLGLENPLLRWLMSHGYWLEASALHWLLAGDSVLHHMSLFLGLFECPHNTAADFPQSKWSKREHKEEVALPFMTKSWESHTITSTIFYSLLQPMFKGRGIKPHLLKGGVSNNLWTYFLNVKTSRRKKKRISLWLWSIQIFIG